MPPFKVIVVGGGLSGALLANGLANNGVDVTVYERDEAHSKRTGYQIRLGHAAIKGLRSCLTESHLSTILGKLGQSTSTTLTAPTLCNTRFQPVVDLSTLPGYSRSSAINRIVLRNLLLEPLEARDLVKFGETFASYEIISEKSGVERVSVHFKSGSSDTCDILVGADGSGSKVNKQVGAKNIVEIDSHWSFLEKGDIPVKQLGQLPSRLLKGPIIAMADGISFFYSLYLPSGENVADSGITYDEAEASFYWGLNVPKSMVPYKDATEISDRRQACLDAVRDWAPEYHKMLAFGAEDRQTSEISVIALRSSKKLPKQWREQARARDGRSKEVGHPRVWLLGDAVHAMQPNRGMGGNQAMLDCADMLPELLELARLAKANSFVSNEQVETGCMRYEERMLDRAFRWVAKSGGISLPNLSFDGLLGAVVSAVSSLVVPVVRLYRRLFPAKESEELL